LNVSELRPEGLTQAPGFDRALSYDKLAPAGESGMPEIEWNASQQSPDELATALFERMVADGMPASVAAQASEQIKRQAIDFVEREQLRMIADLLRHRLRRMVTLTWILCGIAIGQAIGIMILSDWHPATLLAESAVLCLVCYVLWLMLLNLYDLRQTNSDSDSNGGK
jgi:hypothetical protein